jgi:copper chaperone CopZ
VRSALLAVKGVSRAQVSLEGHEALVDFDPKQTNVQALMQAVDEAEAPLASVKYHATVKDSASH